MADLGPVSWPPLPIRTARLLLRQAEVRDRATFIELLTSADVRQYLGGPRLRDEVEHALARDPGLNAGVFVIERDGSTIGTVTIDRRDAERPGHVRPDGNEIELSYGLVSAEWGFGYAAEAGTAALSWIADAIPGEPVVLCTQTANLRSMRLAARLGFDEVERFWEFDAEQWLGVTWVAAGVPTV